MGLLDWLLGRPLATAEAEQQQIGVAAGIPVLGLDALSSAAYGPEAALTLLLPLGAAGLGYLGPISALIIGILLIVYFSYRQTLAAYPGGGGSYTVAKENLGTGVALFAGAALALDYVLNVAVGISAGVGALVSAIPSFLPHTLVLCLGALLALTLINLRGTRESGLFFMLPTYAFVLTLGVVILLGVGHAVAGHGHPSPAAPLAAASPRLQAVGAWVLLKAFASGCTAMTGVEAVSNAVPLFRKPNVPSAQRTLSAIIGILVALLGGIAYLCHAYGISATEPGREGYQSVLSMLTAAVVGRGWFYYATLGSVVVVLALSANTSFADFPRLCRVLADDRFLPDAFAVRGRRLVYTRGILVLATLSGILLVCFGGVTDRLIPLFAIGAFLAFTLSQAGMVQHWLKVKGPGALHSLVLNGAGALATGVTLVVVAVSKFAEGAWLTVVVIPALVLAFRRISRHYRDIAEQISTAEPLELPEARNPIVVVAAGGWSKMTQHGLKFALRLSQDVFLVRVVTESDASEELAESWALLVSGRAQKVGIREPKLVTLTSNFRQFFRPFVEYVMRLEKENVDRDIVVVIPDLVMSHWWEGLLHNNRGAFLRTLLRQRCGDRVVVVNTPFHLK